MIEKSILLTIKPDFAEQILDSDKKTEYRERPPKISKPTRTFLYVSGVKQIIGECTMDPKSGAKMLYGYPLPVYNPKRYATPILWKLIREKLPKIRKPTQNFRYLDPMNDEDSKLLEILQKTSELT